MPFGKSFLCGAAQQTYKLYHPLSIRRPISHAIRWTFHIAPMSACRLGAGDYKQHVHIMVVTTVVSTDLATEHRYILLHVRWIGQDGWQNNAVPHANWKA